MELEQAHKTQPSIEFEDLGLISYSKALEHQLRCVGELVRGEISERIIFCTHHPVVTLGRSSDPSDVFGWQGEVVEVSRGGRATYHGPSQLVIYPIVDLSRARAAFKSKDIHGYLRALEKVVIDALKEIGIHGEAQLAEKADLSLTGVWVENKKVASIGVAIRRWVAYHGIAINCFKDEQAFQGIKPCGFSQDKMSSLEDLNPDFKDLTNLKLALQEAFSAWQK